MAWLLRAGVRTAGVGGQEIRAVGLRRMGTEGRLWARLVEVRTPCEEVVPFFCLATKCEFIYEVSLAEVKINPIYIYMAFRVWQNNDGSKRICIVLGLPYWSSGYIPFCGGDLRKVLAFHLVEVYSKPLWNVVGRLQRHDNSLFFSWSKNNAVKETKRCRWQEKANLGKNYIF